jgi:hypothetical protein
MIVWLFEKPEESIECYSVNEKYGAMVGRSSWWLLGLLNWCCWLAGNMVMPCDDGAY